jgi:cysteine sulfinate desulfinase/cysteine desulfurase-like protein/rhodanese-related sulfurtransferase
MTTEIYLDCNATSVVLPAAMAAATDAMGQRYGNPSSTHGSGLKAKVMLDQARACAVRLLGVGNGRLIFNSGATEGIQTAVLSALVALRERRDAGEAIGTLLVYGATEHKAVPESLAHWNRLLGLNLTLHKLAVDQDGVHSLSALREVVPQAAMLCTMAANNETGVISDLAAIEALLAHSGSKALWLVDCVQALGKLKLALSSTRIDYAPFSGHKLHAPKGVGMLYVRAGAPFTALVMGGGQEAGQRSGTENMAGIAALGAVLSALERGDTFRSAAELSSFRARLADSLRAALPGVVFNNPFDKSLPTTLNFAVPGLSSRELMDVFDAAEVRVSAGSACSSSKAAPSYVLDAMGLPLWRSAGAIRMSFGPLTDEATIAAACGRIDRCGAALRASCLIPSDRTAVPHDGLLQLGGEGACSWMLLDAASRSCIVIDPLPEHSARIEAYVRCQNYQVQAVATTLPNAGRNALVEALGRHVSRAADADAHGWPANAAAIQLGNGSSAGAIRFGAQVLACVPGSADESRAYLLGTAVDGQLPAAAVRFAFIAATSRLPLQLAGLGSADTLVCPTRDGQNQFCSSMISPPAEMFAAEAQLDSTMLDAFLHAHPQACLVDVREPYEFAATMAPLPGGRMALSVPLSRLVEYASVWLNVEHVPLVFFCRSGNRSMKAALCLRRLGHQQAYSLNGGLALAVRPTSSTGAAAAPLLPWAA